MRVIKLLIVLFCISLLGPMACKKRINQISKTNTEDITLKRKFQDAFFIGAALNTSQILEEYPDENSLIEQQFNSITAENAMKWINIEPNPAQFDFEVADKFIALAERQNMQLIGHTLVWHSQIADYMKAAKDSVTVADYMKTHIQTLVNRYQGRINGWDVVNEALNEDGTWRETLFYTAMGESYIDLAFKLAADADGEAALIYNDYNLCQPAKRNGAIRLVEQLKARGTKIDAVGIQAHWQLNSPSLNEIEKSIIAYSNLGVEVMFTELDISVLPNPWDLEGAEVGQNFKELEKDPKMNPYPSKLPDSIQTQLANRYRSIFKLFLKHKDKISRVTFWGVTDKQSWLNNWPIKGRTNYPLLFDRNRQPKPAFSAVVNLPDLN